MRPKLRGYFRFGPNTKERKNFSAFRKEAHDVPIAQSKITDRDQITSDGRQSPVFPAKSMFEP